MISKEFYEKGKKLYDDSKYEDAISPLKKAVGLDKDYQDAIYYLGLCYKYTSHNDDALEQFAKLESVNPDYWGWFYYEAGNALLENGKYDESTDNVGDDNYNMKLSHDRSQSVRDYIVRAEIDPARIQAKGYGKSSPIAANDTEEGRKANRRTEFIILEF